MVWGDFEVDTRGEECDGDAFGLDCIDCGGNQFERME